MPTTHRASIILPLSQTPTFSSPPLPRRATTHLTSTSSNTTPPTWQDDHIVLSHAGSGMTSTVSFILPKLPLYHALATSQRHPSHPHHPPSPSKPILGPTELTTLLTKVLAVKVFASPHISPSTAHTIAHREITTLRLLTLGSPHPNIQRYTSHALNPSPTPSHLITPATPGPTLENFISSFANTPPPSLLAHHTFLTLTPVLTFLHSQKPFPLIHGDLHQGNVLVDVADLDSNGLPKLIVIDFGFAEGFERADTRGVERQLDDLYNLQRCLCFADAVGFEEDEDEDEEDKVMEVRGKIEGFVVGERGSLFGWGEMGGDEEGEREDVGGLPVEKLVRLVGPLVEDLFALALEDEDQLEVIDEAVWGSGWLVGELRGEIERAAREVLG